MPSLSRNASSSMVSRCRYCTGSGSEGFPVTESASISIDSPSGKSYLYLVTTLPTPKTYLTTHAENVLSLKCGS